MNIPTRIDIQNVTMEELAGIVRAIDAEQARYRNQLLCSFTPEKIAEMECQALEEMKASESVNKI